MSTALETLDRCPICKGEQFELALQARDNTVSNEIFKIVHCKDCGLLFTNPRPSVSAIGGYYESMNYISHHDEGKDMMSRAYGWVRQYTTQQKIKLLEKLNGHAGSILDIGSGTGYFLSQAKAAGWKVTGTEPDAEARTAARGRVGEAVHESIWEPILESKIYDAITMWHVLEHVHLLNETFGWLHDHLNPKGKLVIAVPNPESEDARKFKEHWAAYDVPRHLYHFTKKAMTQLAEAHNFKVEQVMPMWFDSYYVSLLSSRYEHGKTNVLQSLWEATRSNWNGRPSTKGQPNTSSLIYILGKS